MTSSLVQLNVRQPRGSRIMSKCLWSLPFAFLFAVATGCGGNGASGGSVDDNLSNQDAACVRVGVSLCAKMYSCYSAAEIAEFQYPATEAECVTEENANCAKAAPKPEFCKGSLQTSDSAADACADELDAQSCDDFQKPTSSGACKAALCSDS
jgi:hypothetical protein